LRLRKKRSGLQSAVSRLQINPADLVERIRRLVDTRAAVNSGMVSAS